MPDIEILNIVTIDFNTIDTKVTDRAASYSTKMDITQDLSNTVKTQEKKLGKPRTLYTNTDSNSNLISYSADKPNVNNNETEYFLPGPNQDSERRASAEITKQLQRF